jgi:Protein of unknown function (DUF3299)
LAEDFGKNMPTAEMPSTAPIAEIQMTSADEVEFPYRAMSSSAIASIVFAVIALLLGYFFWPTLGLAVVGFVVGLAAFRTISRFPEEFDGKQIAVAGMLLNLLVIGLGASFHTYVYLTEVPDGFTRVQFYKLQQEENGPNAPTDDALKIDGQPIFLKGYIHPSSGSGLLKRFILVPDLGTCCFGGQPKSTDMIEVTLHNGQTTKAGLIKKKLAGEFRVNRAPEKLADFDNNVFYRLKVEYIK